MEVFEASDRVGGRMTTDQVGDCLFDRGAQFLSESYSTLIPLLHEVGLGSDLKKSSPWSVVRRGHKIRKFSLENPSSLLTSGYIKPGEAIRLLIGLGLWNKRIAHLPANDYSAWSHFDNEWANEFITREFGKNILEYLIEPQMQGFFYQSPEETSKAMALMLLAFALKKGKVLNLRFGMGSLPEAIAKHLNVRLNCSVLSIKEGSRGKLELVSPDGHFSADRAIIATTATAAKTIYEPQNSVEHALLSTMYSSTINIGIATKSNWELPPDLKDVYGLSLPRRERQLIAGIGIESQKNSECVSSGQLFDIMLDGQKSSDLWDCSTNKIMEKILPELEIYFPKISNNIRLSHFIKWKDAEPKSPLGRSIHIKKYKESLSTDSKVVLAGDYMGFPYTDSAAATGKWAAEFIHRSLK